ncbi:hypothetical protein ROLI_003730 [Roseobacter fucihabitans]|uniref:Uncharacterized protein n=1 Tax=Roseobacter fucihabitans TaxID=1537242 RepID=A0ABZ2BPP7_9RHOB|nr:hypothetical protein [Roseobacter litoralis]
MSGPGQTEMKQIHPRFAQHLHHGRTAPLVRAMHAPGDNHLIRPTRGFYQNRVAFRANGIMRALHGGGVGIAPGKDIGDTKRPKPQMPCAGLAAGNGRVVFDFYTL